MSPWAPLQRCLEPGCGALVRRGRCPKHMRERERARGSPSRRGYGSAHHRWRADGLRLEPDCADPFGRHPGQRVDATVADHIVPVRLGGQWTAENRQMLCASCHAEKRRREGGGGIKS